MTKITIFKNSFAEKPDERITMDELVKRIKEGHWSKVVDRLRNIKDLRYYKKAKEALPGVTISGDFKTRDKFTKIKDRLIKHSGYICLDLDRKDNPMMRVQDLIDSHCLCQFVSCSGEGIKIVYKCTTTKDSAVHRRIYDAAVQRLDKKGIKLKVDPMVKNIMSLQYVSYDPNIFYFPKTKLVIKPLPPIKIKKVRPSVDQKKEIEQLNDYIKALGNKDITGVYDDWVKIGMGLTYSLGEAGRTPFHLLSKNYKTYSKEDTDEKYDDLLERDPKTITVATTLASVYQLINAALPKTKVKQLSKKYNQSHSVGIGEDVEQGDLKGMVRYKLFLFKKILDKSDNKFTLKELLPAEINLNAFEALLKSLNFYRFEDAFVHIVDNIVDKVDRHDVLRIVTDFIEKDGDYNFTYHQTEFQFNVEELAHLWRTVRANQASYNQLFAGLDHWQPDLLSDTPTESFIPFKNGVVRVTGKEPPKLIPYKEIKQQIWRERILPRNFDYTTKVGMFEQFFINVCGRGKRPQTSEEYYRALWYFGYMLQGTKNPALARAWMLYDINVGNNGRSGKTIIGRALGHIRFVTTIDGKQIDFRNRFWLQSVKPWTEIIFIDDPLRGMSLTPMFNMISGTVYADRKGLEPLEIKPKFLFASNWVMESEGSSEADRQFITQLSDFYVKYGKEHGDTSEPVVKYHGKVFFEGWNEKDWKEFDSFAVRSIRHHLYAPSPKNTIIGDSKVIRFKQIHGEELLYDLKQCVKTNFDSGSNCIMISLLVNVVKDHDSSLTGIKASRIVRTFMDAINSGKLTIQTKQNGSRIVNVYKTEHGLKEMNL